MKNTPDPLLDIVRRPPAMPAPEAPLSVYNYPEFWRGAAASRNAPNVGRLYHRVIEERETLVGAWPFRTVVRTQIIERVAPLSAERVAEINDEALKALSRLERAAGKRDLAAMPSYHSWLSQNTKPAADAPVEEE
jgi:hypothetical protein